MTEDSPPGTADPGTAELQLGIRSAHLLFFEVIDCPGRLPGFLVVGIGIRGRDIVGRGVGPAGAGF